MRPLLFWALLATHGIPPRGPQHPGGCERLFSWPAESFFGKTWFKTLWKTAAAQKLKKGVGFCCGVWSTLRKIETWGIVLNGENGHPSDCASQTPARVPREYNRDPNGSLPGRSREAPGRVRTIFRDPPGKLPGSRDPPGNLRRRGRPPALLHAADSCCHRRRAAAAIPGAERRSVARDAACAGDNSRRRTPPVTRSGQLLPPATGSGRNPWR
eukprot:gene12515-biopygen1923